MASEGRGSVGSVRLVGGVVRWRWADPCQNQNFLIQYNDNSQVSGNSGKRAHGRREKSFGHNRAQLKAWNVEMSPVPLLVLPSVKTNPDGSYDKHKVRICLCGSPFYMQKGVHFSKTYAATADVCSIRLISAIGLLLNWKCRAWDVSTAYLQADRDQCTSIPLRLPQGFRTNEHHI